MLDNLKKFLGRTNDELFCEIYSIDEYIKCQYIVLPLIKLIGNWKQSEVLLCGERYTNGLDFYNFVQRLKTEARKYEPMIQTSLESVYVSMGNIAYEPSLPLQYTHYPDIYGAIFAFSDDIDGQLFCCSCQKETAQRLIKSRQEANFHGIDIRGGIHYLPKALETIIDKSDTLLEGVQFKDNLCFRCNHVMPSLEYCNAMYGGSFKRHYGWYIAQKTLDLHHAYYADYQDDMELETAEIYDTIRRIRTVLDEKAKHTPEQEEYHQLFKQYEKTNRQLQNAIENCVRKELGFKEIGSAWVSETILYEIVKSIFPHSTIKRHHRPTWLDKLELDIFLEEEKIAFEYQGIQHFKAVEHWGGQQQLEKQQEHDRRKKKLCREQNIKLVCINYDEPLNASYVKSKLQNTL